jgi:putative ABC transport system permease protein
MSFILKMAWRDSRASRRRLILFSLSVVFGIAALVALGSFSVSLAVAVRSQAKGLLGADLIVSSRVPFSPGVQRYLDSLGGRQAHGESFTSMLSFPASGNATHLVQVRAREGGYPFYGEFVTEPADAVSQWREVSAERAAPAVPTAGASRPGGADVAILEDTLMNEFNVRVGDFVKLGNANFKVIGALKKIPGESLAVAMLAPRVLIPLRAMPGLGLGGPGSLVSHWVALGLPNGRDPEALVQDMREAFAADRLSFDTVAGRERELGRTITNVDGFLSLVGFIALLLGSIGVASAIHVYVRQKRATVAVLRCLGASARQGFSVYLVQGLALGALGAALGGILGVGVQAVFPAMVKGLLPFTVEFSIAWSAVARGMGAGFVVCGLFTLLPLLAVRNVTPLEALRSADASVALPRRGAFDPWVVVVSILIAASVSGFAIWQTRSVRLGLGFAAMLAVSLGVLAGLARATAWAARRGSPRRLPYVVRQGIANLHRPNNRTALLLLSLGLGTFLVLTLFLTRTALLREISSVGGGDRPNLLFFDIQDDQIAPLGRLVASLGSPVLRRAPIVTMRITAVRGRSVTDLLGDKSERMPAWSLRREYRSTYRDRLNDTEKIVDGEFVGRVAPAMQIIPISVEEGLADEMRLKLGDEVDWDIQGVTLRSRVASLRSVEWRRLEPNFFVVFPEGVLDSAPKFHVAAVRAQTAVASAGLQRAIVRDFPNVTAIDLALVLATVDGVLGKATFVIEFMALFTVATGLLVLACAVVNGRYQRRLETVLLRTLGATRVQLARIQLVEYAVLGGLAASVGALLSLVASGLLASLVFRIPPAAPPLALVLSIVGVSGLTLLVGRFADRGLMDQPPLEVLRAENS